MANLLRALVAGVGARQANRGCFGGGCLGFIVLFVILYWVLGGLGL